MSDVIPGVCGGEANPRPRPCYTRAMAAPGLLRASHRMALLIVFLSSLPAPGQTKTLPLDSLDALKPHKVKAEAATLKGRKAICVTDAVSTAGEGNEDRFVLVAGAEFQNGVIEIDLAGEPGPGASEQARG